MSGGIKYPPEGEKREFDPFTSQEMAFNFLNNIMLGDCMVLLRNIPDNSIDLSFADPPFNLKKKYGSYNDGRKEKEYLLWCEAWLDELVRVTKPTGSIILHNIPKWLLAYAGIMNNLAEFKHWITWDASTRPMGKSLQPACYGFLYYAKDLSKNKFYEIRYPHKRDRKTGVLSKDYGGKKRLLHPFGPLVSDVWTDIHRIKHRGKRDNHPCQLPLHLMERIILMTTDEGDTVLDPFMGTGTTAIAAKHLGRNYVGSEIDISYVAIANKKLSETSSDSKIGTSWVSFYRGEVATLRDCDWEDLKGYFIIPSPIRNIETTKISLRVNDSD